MKIDTNQADYQLLTKKYQQLQLKERYLAIINSFAIQLMHLSSIDDVVWGIAKLVIARMDFEDCVIYLLDKEKNILIQKAAHGPKNPYKLDIKNPITIKVGEGIVGHVAQTGEPEIISDTRLDARYILDDEYRLSEIAVPIVYKNEVIGVIDSEHSEKGFFTQEHLLILKTVAAISSTKIMHARANEVLKNYQLDLEKEVSLKTRDLRLVIDKLKKSNQDLESFAYAASHDLQEPLRTIVSYLQLIERKENNFSTESQEYFDYVVKGAKRMKNLLQGLLEYSRLRPSNEEMQPLDMNQLLELVQANLYGAIQSEGAQIIVSDLYNINGNRTQIIQLFQNIISNALKFRKKDTPSVVSISSVAGSDYVEIKICDNGIGIHSDFQEKIFGLFSRLNPIGTFQGSGIGLALCKRIVEYHQGRIKVISELGEGTCFYLTFPKK